MSWATWIWTPLRASVSGSVLLVVVVFSLATTATALSFPRLTTTSGEDVTLVGGDFRAVTSSARRVVVDPHAHIEEPDVLETWAEWGAFVRGQDALDALASDAGPFHLERADGTRFEVVFAPASPTHLPFEFWLQIATAAFCCLAAELTYRLGQPSLPLIGYRVAGWGVAFAAWSSALYTTRSLCLPGVWFEVAHTVNAVAGAPVFGAGATLLLAMQPRRLFRAWPLLFAGPVVVGVLWTLRLDAVGPATSVYGTIVLYVLGLFVFLAWQRRGIRRDPIAHAIWRWQALAVLGGIAFFVIAQGVPALLGAPPWATQGATLVGFAVMFALMSLGAARLSLFSVSRWWGRAWLGVIAGVLVLGFDAALASILPAGQLPTALALGIVGWLYFPLRRWLFGRISGRHKDSWASDVKLLAGARNLAEHLLRFEEVLHSRYRPSRFALGEHADRTHLVEQGRGLVVPWPSGDKSYRLELKQGGMALFEVRDVQEVEALLDVARGLIDGLEAYDQGERSERERIRRDIHDHLGAQLSRLARDSAGTELEENVRGVVTELRHVSSALLAESALVADVLLEIEAEARSLARSFELPVAFDFSHAGYGSTELGASARADLLAVVREGLTNVMRHGSVVDSVRVSASREQDDLVLRIESRVRPESATAPDWGLALGSGLKNLERRAELRGGVLRVERVEQLFRLSFCLPLGFPRSRDSIQRLEQKAAE